MYICMYVQYVCMHVCTKSFLKTTTNSLCVCAHLANKADSDSDSDKLNIVSASLFVKKVSVSPGVRLGHAQALLSTTAKYPIERVCLKNFSIPVRSRVSNQENLFLGTLPKSIILAMTENSSFSGAYDKNPFAFKHFNLEFMALYRDGIQIPSKPL